MTSYEWFVFFLCLFIFVGLVLFLGILLLYIYILTKKNIRGGLDDERIIKEKEKAKKQKGNKFFDMCGKVISFLALFVVAFTFLYSMNVKAMEDLTPNGMSTIQVVMSDSMASKNKKNDYLDKYNLNNQFKRFDLVTIHKLPGEFELKLYDIVVYKHDKDILIIHRIIGIEEPNEKHPEHRHFLLRGDANDYDDKFPVLYDQMMGIYTGDKIPNVGSFVCFLQSPSGWMCVIFVVFMTFFIPAVEDKIQRDEDERYKLIS